MSLLEKFKVKRIELTKELYEKYEKELLDILSVQYVRKDPSMISLTPDLLYKLFKEEYEAIFSLNNDKSYKIGFLYFDENGTLIGNFMIRDAFLSCKNHEKELATMKPEDNNYGFYIELVKNANEIFGKYQIKEGESIYGTNLAFSAKFLEKFAGKKVLTLILAMFIDLSFWWENYLKDFKYGIWFQLRQSLSTITEKAFNCLEARDFLFLGDDKKQYAGKFFLVQRKSSEELQKIWENFDLD